MDTLKSLVRFSGVPPGGQVSLPHGLNDGYRAVRPDRCGRSSAFFTVIIGLTDENQITVRNDGPAPGDCLVLCEFWHTVERAFGAAQTVELQPQTYVEDNDVSAAISGGSLQAAYDASAGPQATVALDVIRNGIRLVDIAGLATPVLDLVSTTATAQPSLRVTRSPTAPTGGAVLDIAATVNATGTIADFVSAGPGSVLAASHTPASGASPTLSLTRHPTVALAGAVLAIAMGVNGTGDALSITKAGPGDAIDVTLPAASTADGIHVLNQSGLATRNLLSEVRGAAIGFRLAEEAGQVATGTGLDLVRNATGSTGTLVSLSKQPAAPTLGLIIDLTASINATDTLTRLTSAGPGTVLSVIHTPSTLNNDTVSLTRNPTAAIAGAVLAISMGANATGDALAITKNGTGDAIMVTLPAASSANGLFVLNQSGLATTNILVQVRGPAIGIRLEEEAGQVATSTGIQIVRNATGSTGIMLSLTKSPAAATGGGVLDLAVGLNATGTAINVTTSGTGAALNIAHTPAAAASTSVTLTRTPSVAGIAGNILTLVGGANMTGDALSIVHSGSADAIRVSKLTAGGHAVEITSAAAHTGNAIRVVYGGSATGVSIEHSGTGVGRALSVDVVAGDDNGLRVRDISAAASANPLVDISRATAGTGALVLITRAPAALTAGNLLVLSAGVNATGDAINSTHAGTGRFMTVAQTGTGEIWRITGTAGVLRSVMDNVGRLGLGVVPASPARLALKEHAAFANSEYQETTGSVQTVGAVTGDALTLALLDNTTYVLEAMVVGRDTSGAERAAYVVRAGAFRQGGGGATLIGAGSPQASFTDETNVLADATIVVAGNNAIVRVTGTAGLTYNWACTLKWQAIQTNA